MNNNNRFVLAVDCDEVLVNITPKWVDRFINSKEAISHFDEETINKIKEIQPNDRHTYYIHEWLDISNHGALLEAKYNMYYDDPHFYDDLTPTPYFESIKILLQSNLIEELHIVTSCKDENLPATKSKRDFLLKQLKPHKNDANFSFYFLDSKTSKSKCINDNDIAFHSFVDDHLGNIIDVIENVPHSSYKEFLIPLYGYNSIDKFEKAPFYEMTKGIQIKYFNNDSNSIKIN